MPKITVTEEERVEILRMREVRALQAVAWNEAIDACRQLVIPARTHDEIADEMLALKRNPSRP